MAHFVIFFFHSNYAPLPLTNYTQLYPVTTTTTLCVLYCSNRSWSHSAISSAIWSVAIVKLKAGGSAAMGQLKVLKSFTFSILASQQLVLVAPTSGAAPAAQNSTSFFPLGVSLSLSLPPSTLCCATTLTHIAHTHTHTLAYYGLFSAYSRLYYKLTH